MSSIKKALKLIWLIISAPFIVVYEIFKCLAESSSYEDVDMRGTPDIFREDPYSIYIKRLFQNDKSSLFLCSHCDRCIEKFFTITLCSSMDSVYMATRDMDPLFYGTRAMENPILNLIREIKKASQAKKHTF